MTECKKQETSFRKTWTQEASTVVASGDGEDWNEDQQGSYTAVWMVQVWSSVPGRGEAAPTAYTLTGKQEAQKNIKMAQRLKSGVSFNQ